MCPSAYHLLKYCSSWNNRCRCALFVWSFGNCHACRSFRDSSCASPRYAGIHSLPLSSDDASAHGCLAAPAHWMRCSRMMFVVAPSRCRLSLLHVLISTRCCVPLLSVLSLILQLRLECFLRAAVPLRLLRCQLSLLHAPLFVALG